MSAGVSDPQVIGTLLLSSTALVSLVMARIGKTRVKAGGAASRMSFTDDIHASLVVATRDALSLRHTAVDVEHVLLGILATNAGRGNTILARIGVNPARVHDALLAAMRPGHVFSSFDLPYSHRALGLLDEAALEALALGHPRAGTEHVILGILRQKKGLAARVLIEAGATLEAMRRETARFAT